MFYTHIRALHTRAHPLERAKLLKIIQIYKFSHHFPKKKILILKKKNVCNLHIVIFVIKILKIGNTAANDENARQDTLAQAGRASESTPPYPTHPMHPNP